MNIFNDLQINMDFIASYNGKYANFGSTYRDAGLSVGANCMRLHGEVVYAEVSFQDLDIKERIGQGACSSVYRCTHHKTNDNYAVKMFNVLDDYQAKQLLQEIAILSTVNCETLITMKGAFHNEGSIGVILEYMDHGSLENIIQLK